MPIVSSDLELKVVSSEITSLVLGRKGLSQYKLRLTYALITAHERYGVE